MTLGVFLVILGSIMIVVGGCLIWRASVILQRFLHQEKLEVSLAGMIEELEAVTRSSLEAIRHERAKVEELLSSVSQQVTLDKEVAAATESSVSDDSISDLDRSDRKDAAMNSLNLERCTQVWKLTEAGVASYDIAKQLGMGRGEVELIQGLRDYCGLRDETAPDKS